MLAQGCPNTPAPDQPDNPDYGDAPTRAYSALFFLAADPLTAAHVEVLHKRAAGRATQALQKLNQASTQVPQAHDRTTLMAEDEERYQQATQQIETARQKVSAAHARVVVLPGAARVCHPRTCGASRGRREPTLQCRELDARAKQSPIDEPSIPVLRWQP